MLGADAVQPNRNAGGAEVFRGGRRSAWKSLSFLLKVAKKKPMERRPGLDSVALAVA